MKRKYKRCERDNFRLKGAFLLSLHFFSFSGCRLHSFVFSSSQFARLETLLVHWNLKNFLSVHETIENYLTFFFLFFNELKRQETRAQEFLCFSRCYFAIFSFEFEIWNVPISSSTRFCILRRFTNSLVAVFAVDRQRFFPSFKWISRTTFIRQ